MSTPPSNEKPTLGVGMVGYAFMGAAHSQAWRTAFTSWELSVRRRWIGRFGNRSMLRIAASL